MSFYTQFQESSCNCGSCGFNGEIQGNEFHNQFHNHSHQTTPYYSYYPASGIHRILNSDGSRSEEEPEKKEINSPSDFFSTYRLKINGVPAHPFFDDPRRWRMSPTEYAKRSTAKVEWWQGRVPPMVPEDTGKERDPRKQVLDMLNYIANKFSKYYGFNHDKTDGPEIEDVLEARKGMMGKEWQMLIHEEDGFETEFIFSPNYPFYRGDPKATQPLPNAFKPEQWAFIERMHNFACGHEDIVTPGMIERLGKLALVRL